MSPEAPIALAGTMRSSQDAAGCALSAARYSALPMPLTKQTVMRTELPATAGAKKAKVAAPVSINSPRLAALAVVQPPMLDATSAALAHSPPAEAAANFAMLLEPSAEPLSQKSCASITLTSEALSTFQAMPAAPHAAPDVAPDAAPATMMAHPRGQHSAQPSTAALDRGNLPPHPPAARRAVTLGESCGTLHSPAPAVKRHACTCESVSAAAPAIAAEARVAAAPTDSAASSSCFDFVEPFTLPARSPNVQAPLHFRLASQPEVTLAHEPSAAGAGPGLSLSISDRQVAKEASMLARPCVASERKLQQRQHVSLATALVSSVIECEARSLVEKAFVYFASLADGSKVNYPLWLIDLAQRVDGRPSVLCLCIVKWKRMLVAGHERRAAYAAKRVLQRDTLLGSLSASLLEDGLAGLQIDQPECPTAPPAGWQDVDAVDIHAALVLQRRHAPLDSIHGLLQRSDNSGVVTTMVEEPVQSSGELLSITNAVVSGLRSVLESASDVPTSAFALPGELPGCWCRTMLPVWLPSGTPSAVLRVAKASNTAEHALQLVSGAARGASSGLRFKGLRSQLDAAQLSQASVQRELGTHSH